MVWVLVILFHHLCVPSVFFLSLYWVTQSQKWYCSTSQWIRRDINYISGKLWLHYREVWMCTVTFRSESPIYSGQQNAVPGVTVRQPLNEFVWQPADLRLQYSSLISNHLLNATQTPQHFSNCQGWPGETHGGNKTISHWLEYWQQSFSVVLQETKLCLHSLPRCPAILSIWS